MSTLAYYFTLYALLFGAAAILLIGEYLSTMSEFRKQEIDDDHQ